MTINEAISRLKSKLGERGYDDDSLQTDESLYNIIVDSAAVVFSRYKEKYYKISDFMFNTYGVKLKQVPEDMFPCEDFEHCTVWESEFEIPESMVSRHKLMFKVYKGKEELPEYRSSNIYDDSLKTKPSWEIFNGKLRIHNVTGKLKGVTIKTIPANVMEWLDKKYCPDTDTVECYNLDSLKLNLLADRKFSSMTFELALKEFEVILNEPERNQAH